MANNEDEEITAHLTFIEQKINEAAANELVEANYQAKMKAGEDFAKAEDFQKALNAFQEALEIKENDPNANSRIADMQQKLEGLEKQDEKEERYSLAMEAGKEAMTAEDFAAAIKHFDDALLEKPMDNEANRLLVEAKNKIEALKSEEERYEAFLSEGNSLLTLAKSNNNHIPTLEEAKAKFREAQLMRPQASLPQNKIVEIDNLLRQIEEEQEALKNQNVELQYQEKIEMANIAAQGENYQNAINYLKEASDLKPNEQYPKDKIEEYQNIIDQIANQQAIEAQYKDLINKADLAFDNKQYQNSISLYNQALAIKENEAYFKGQIAKAKQAIEDANEGAEEQQYLSFISQGDQKFTNKSFEEALTYYEAALGVKENDSYAKDRVSEIKQILDNLKTKEAEEQAKRALYEKHIAEADALFNSEDYIEAKKRYDQAVYVIPNDVYAIERAQLSERKAKEKTEEEDNALYQKIIAKADEYFDDDSFDQARELYERALNLRSYDRYPQDKINEIIALQNANVKTNSNVEYLGEKQNISIMEGAALLEAGARQREQMKLENVQAHLRKNEGIARDLSEKDLLERHAYENEIVSIRDRRNNLYLEVQDKQHEFAQYVDEMAEGLEKHQKQIYDFHTGDVNRIYRDVEYIEIAYEEMLSQYKEDHQGIIDQVDIIEKGREVQARAELARHRDGVEATSQEILSTEKKNEDHYALSRIKQQELEVSVDDIIKGRELRTFEKTNDLYDKISQLEADALLAEIRVSDAKDEKLAINKQLEDDIYALDAALKRKQEVESDEAYDTQMQIDGQLLAASNHYEATIQGKDETRQLIVNRVKDLEKSQEVQAAHRAEKHYQETQNITTDAENIMIQREESVIQQAKDLAAVDRAIKNQEEAFSRASHERNQEESRQRHATMNQLERIKKDEEITKMEGAQKAQNNYEDVKGLSASIDDNTQADLENLRDRAVRTQELVDQLESNKLTYSPLIANTIGDEYPEGVTQENYIRRDNNGIPVQIVTRRFVVQEGHGDIYIRIQTRNGITYSKNGNPITEQSWINGTENANLEKHY